ncbi:hypothetical protein BKA70DRAFT_1424377 [Coprinopsis sp. MPI-PUGE-AT-0042]|nr:hypothetical protein BKA70DRAFT_1424377 [Coprinopsis sp. MPI-PUGE-AT-0042]
MAFVERLLEGDDIRVNAADKTGSTPLIWALRRGHHDIVEMLLERDDIQPNAANEYVSTLLSWALKMGHKKIVKVLLERDDIQPNFRSIYTIIYPITSRPIPPIFFAGLGFSTLPREIRVMDSLHHALQDYVGLLSSVPLEEMHIEFSCQALWDSLWELVPFFDRDRDGFDVVDEHLSDRARFPRLGELVVEARVYAPISAWLQQQLGWSRKDYRDASNQFRARLTEEINAVFVNASKTVGEFQVKMHKATCVGEY